MPPCYLQRTYISVAAIEAHNLRSRPPRNFAENANEEIAAIEAHNLRPRLSRNFDENANEEIDEDLDYEPIGDFLCDNEGIIACLLLYLPT